MVGGGVTDAMIETDVEGVDGVMLESEVVAYVANLDARREDRLRGLTRLKPKGRRPIPP